MSEQEFERYDEPLRSLLKECLQRGEQAQGETTAEDGGSAFSQSQAPAWDCTAQQAPPDLASRTAEPSVHCVTRQEPGNEERPDVTKQTAENGTLRNIAEHERPDVTKQTAENGTLRNIPSHGWPDVTKQNPENETLRNIVEHGRADVTKQTAENVTLRNMVERDPSAEAIEAYACETSTEPIDPTDPTTKINRRELLAIGGLLSGSTVTETAEQIGVTRQTVHRWLHNPTFQAAYRHCEAELRMAAQAQTAGLVEKAVRCVEQGLDRGNARVGLELLKLFNVFSSHPKPDRIERATRMSVLAAEGNTNQ